jgi:hypothetical protein
MPPADPGARPRGRARSRQRARREQDSRSHADAQRIVGGPRTAAIAPLCGRLCCRQRRLAGGQEFRSYRRLPGRKRSAWGSGPSPAQTTSPAGAADGLRHSSDRLHDARAVDTGTSRSRHDAGRPLRSSKTAPQASLAPRRGFATALRVNCELTLILASPTFIPSRGGIVRHAPEVQFSGRSPRCRGRGVPVSTATATRSPRVTPGAARPAGPGARPRGRGRSRQRAQR